MIEIKGLYNTAICYTDILEDSAKEQIRQVCDRIEFADCKIRIMPDVHSGKGCTIGTTMSIKDKIVPGMVGVDIGCGIETVKIEQKSVDFAKLDNVIRRDIPSGRNIRKQPHDLSREIALDELKCKDKVNLNRAYRSIGTLGGGNHFIEIDRDDEGSLYLVVHSGSRHLGNEVAMYYQQQGLFAMWGGADYQIEEKIEELKLAGLLQQIEPTVKALKRKHHVDIPNDLAYVEGKLFDDYIHDMKIVQKYAELNRRAMCQVITDKMGLEPTEHFTTIHNYIDTEQMILRKGAVAANKGQKLLVPINMRDGSLICIGKGNPDWNCSAPHGAGRLMSRSDAFKNLSLDEYKTQMSDIYTSCVNRKTLDESPMAYKPMENIIKNIYPTAQIQCIIKPIYNFKAAE